MSSNVHTKHRYPTRRSSSSASSSTASSDPRPIVPADLVGALPLAPSPIVTSSNVDLPPIPPSTTPSYRASKGSALLSVPESTPVRSIPTSPTNLDGASASGAKERLASDLYKRTHESIALRDYFIDKPTSEELKALETVSWTNLLGTEAAMEEIAKGLNKAMVGVFSSIVRQIWLSGGGADFSLD